MTKYLIAITLVLAALLALASWAGLKQRDARVAAEAQVQRLEDEREATAEALKRAQAMSARLAQKKAATARESASARQSTDRALATRPDWANEEVPKEVQDALAE